MRTVKYLFFGYLALIVLVVLAYGVSRLFSPPRDPETLFATYAVSIRSLDPVKIADVQSADIAGHVYECLYNYRYGGKPDELFPQLAADFPKVSEDGLTYTFTLRRGIRFYDPRKTVWADGVGPEVKAGDVLYSWKRMANFHSAAPSYSTVLQDNIVGLDAFRAATEKMKAGEVNYEAEVAGLKALDDYTVQVKLNQPVPNFVQLTAYLGLAVMSREAVDANGGTLRDRPVGTGPYALEEYKADQRVVLRANPTYRGRPDVDGEEGKKLAAEERLPHIKRIQWDYTLEALPAWHLFMQGRYDIMGIPKETYKDAVVDEGGEKRASPELEKKGIVLRTQPDMGVFFLQFNMTDPVVGKNKALRQAMSLAIDREAFIKIYMSGRGTPGTGILPPDAPLFDPNYRSQWCRFDVEAAKAKLKEAEAIHGGPIPVLKMQVGDTDTEARQSTEFYIRQWARIGLRVEPEYNNYARFLERMDAKDYQFTSAGWSPDYPDEKTYLALFDARLAKPPGSNSTGYSDPTYQALLEKAQVMPRSPERDKLYMQMRDIVDEDLPFAPLFYRIAYGLRYDWVGNVQRSYYTQGIRAYQTLDVERRRHATLGRGH